MLPLLVCFKVQIGDITFRTLWRHVTDIHTVPLNTTSSDSNMYSFCKSFVPPSIDMRKFLEVTYYIAPWLVPT